MKLNLGCGSTSLKGYVNADIAPLDNVDVVMDLDSHPWPFDNECAEMVIAQDVFEHLNDPIGFMVDCWRVMLAGSPLVIRTPHYQSEHAFTDPTHKRYCTEFSWDYWIPGTALYKAHNEAYGRVRFRKEKLDLLEGTLYVRLSKLP